MIKVVETYEDTLINKDNAYACVIRNWMDRKTMQSLVIRLEKELNWLKGMDYPVPTPAGPRGQSRDFYVMGDNTDRLYYYSQKGVPVAEWCPEVYRMKERVEQQYGVKYNSCLINRYRNGKENIGWHRDKEALGVNCAVATVSGYMDLDEGRDFYLRREDTGVVIPTKLYNGDLCLMLGENCQKLYKHCIPKRARAGYRLSFTFRYIKQEH